MFSTASSCVIGADPMVASQSCTVNDDCARGYVCVLAIAPDIRVCELNFPARIPPTGSGPAAPAPAGPLVTYCADVKPIFQARCVQSCHGPASSGGTVVSGIVSYRADRWEADPASPGQKGISQQLMDTTTRILSRNMPSGSTLPEEEYAKMKDWITGGSKLSADGKTCD
jgi:hypothetical protein